MGRALCTWHVDLPHETAPLPSGSRPLVSLDDVREGDTLFVKTDLLDSVAPHLHRISAPLRLVTGHSDLGPSPGALHAITSLPNFASWDAVNYCGRALPGWPLGLAEPDRSHGDQAAVSAAHARFWGAGGGAGVLVTAHGPSHPIRSFLTQHWTPPRGCTVRSDRMTYAQYLDALGGHAFVLAPRGNGADVHRVYEAVITRTRPIYVSDDRPPAIYAAMPVVITCTTRDLTTVVTAALAGHYPAPSEEQWEQSLRVCRFGYSPNSVSSSASTKRV